MHAFSSQRVEVNRERGDQRLAFAGLHFRDFSVVQRDAADELDIEVPHADEAAAGLTHGGESGDEQVVERGALLDLLAEIDGLRRQVLVGELLHARFQFIDGRDERAYRLDLALVFSAKNFGENRIYHFYPPGSLPKQLGTDD